MRRALDGCASTKRGSRIGLLQVGGSDVAVSRLRRASARLLGTPGGADESGAVGDALCDSRTVGGDGGRVVGGSRAGGRRRVWSRAEGDRERTSQQATPGRANVRAEPHHHHSSERPALVSVCGPSLGGRPAMNLSLVDPFVLAQDCPEVITGRLRECSCSCSCL